MIVILYTYYPILFHFKAQFKGNDSLYCITYGKLH